MINLIININALMNFLNFLLQQVKDQEVTYVYSATTRQAMVKVKCKKTQKVMAYQTVMQTEHESKNRNGRLISRQSSN